MTSTLLTRLRSWFSAIPDTLTSSEFWRGYSGAFNLFPFPEDYHGYPHKSVEDALRSDWESVGGDMWKALNEFERNHGIVGHECSRPSRS